MPITARFEEFTPKSEYMNIKKTAYAHRRHRRRGRTLGSVGVSPKQAEGTYL
jgi:hypothetical protein